MKRTVVSKWSCEVSVLTISERPSRHAFWKRACLSSCGRSRKPVYLICKQGWRDTKQVSSSKGVLRRGSPFKNTGDLRWLNSYPNDEHICKLEEIEKQNDLMKHTFETETECCFSCMKYDMNKKVNKLSLLDGRRGKGDALRWKAAHLRVFNLDLFWKLMLEMLTNQLRYFADWKETINNFSSCLH